MLQAFPIEIYEFVEDVAIRNGFELSLVQSDDPPSTLIVQPIDADAQVGPDSALVGKFVDALRAEQAAYNLQTRIHIEAISGSSPVPFGSTDNLPDMVHLVQISTLE